LVIGAIAAIIILLIGYVVSGAAAANRAIGDADKTLKATIDHQTAVGRTLGADPLKNIDFKSDNPDIGAAKSALAAYEVELSRARVLVNDDRARLRAAAHGLAGSVLTAPEGGTLDQRRRRVDAALTALDSAQRALDLNQKVADFAHPFFDGMAALEALNSSIKANDLAASLSQLSAAQDGINKAVDLAKPPAIPKQVVGLLASIGFLLTDMQGFLAAAQAHDSAGMQHYQEAAGGALNGLAEYDPQIVDQYYTQMLTRLSDSYKTNLKIAAGP
jgi:hypothetical protein